MTIGNEHYKIEGPSCEWKAPELQSVEIAKTSTGPFNPTEDNVVLNVGPTS